MDFARSAMAGVRWTTYAILCGSLHAQSLSEIGSTRPRSHVPSSEQSSDGMSIYGTPETTAEGVLKEMASRASVIFTGTVSAIKKSTDKDLQGNVAASVVEVHFAVDQAVRGVADGSTYVMREWGGLWRDSPRFMPGQRVLMLLHAPGPGGLSSPVDGLDGVIPIKATDAPVDTTLSALASGTPDMTSPQDSVDMRWLQAKTLRTQIFSDTPIASPGENLPGGLATTQTPDVPVFSASSATAQPMSSTGLTRVLGLLMTWQGTRNASR